MALLYLKMLMVKISLVKITGNFYIKCLLYLFTFILYCESILFRGAEISSFEDDGHIHGYLTSLIALPTKLKKYKIITFNF